MNSYIESVYSGLSAGAVGGVSTAIFLVSFSAGTVLAVLITHCFVRRKKKKSTHEQTDHSSLEASQPAPVYAEVVRTTKMEMKENPSYVVTVGKLEMKKNPSYGPVGH